MQKIRAAIQPERRPHSPGWELRDFYQWEMPCRVFAANSQREWTQERKRILARPGSSADGIPLFTDADLPIERYRCVPMKCCISRVRDGDFSFEMTASARPRGGHRGIIADAARAEEGNR